MSLPTAPLNRIETYLAYLCGEDVVLPDAPLNNIETYLAKLCEQDVTLPSEPLNDIETLLAIKCDETHEIPSWVPLNHIEAYLLKWIGETEETPEWEPLNNIEMYLKELCEEQPSVVVKILTSLFPMTVSDASAGNVVSLDVNGNTKRTITIDGNEYVVPDGYTIREYIENSASHSKVSTGIVPSDTDCEYYCKFYCADVGSYYIMQSRASSGNIWGITGSQTNATIGFAINGTTITSSITRVVGHTYEVTASYSDGEMWLNVVDLTTGDGATTSGTQSFGTPSAEISLFTNASDQSVASGNRIYEAYYKEDGEYKFLVKATTDSSNNVGMYDFVSKSAMTTSGTFTAGTEAPCPDVPLGVVGVGDKTSNLWDKSKSTTKWINGSGAEVDYPNGNAQMSDYVECSEGDKFTICGFYNGSQQTYTQMEIAWYNSSKTFISRDSLSGGGKSHTATAPSNAAYCKFGLYNVNSTSVINHNSMAVLGDTAPTEYIKFGYKFEMLKASNCGCKIMTGTETINQYQTNTKVWFDISDRKTGGTGYSDYYSLNESSSGTDTGVWFSNTSKSLVITDIEHCSSPTVYKAWLAERYASGNPVIFYYEIDGSSWTTPTEYTAYRTNPFYKVGTYADILGFTGGDDTRKIGVKVLDGTESWTYDSTYHRFYTAITDAMHPSPRTMVAYCTHFTMLSNNEPISSVVSGQGYLAGPGVYFHYDMVTDVDAWKDYLAYLYAEGTPVIIVYPLATPTTETGDAVTIPFADNTNYLECLTEVQPSTSELKYYAEA